MTKKHFKAIADAIDWSTVSCDHEIVVKQSLIERLCSIFKKENPRFDQEKFMRACEGKKENVLCKHD